MEGKKPLRILSWNTAANTCMPTCSFSQHVCVCVYDMLVEGRGVAFYWWNVSITSSVLKKMAF